MSRTIKATRRNSIKQSYKVNILESIAEGKEIFSEGLKRRDSVDTAIYICKKCRIAWQNAYSSTHGSVDYYEDFPTIGKERKNCPKCE